MIDDDSECQTCDGEREIQGANTCTISGCDSCGGCFDYEPCPDCGGDHEPDWDAIAEDRAESRALSAQDEVEWESPE